MGLVALTGGTGFIGGRIVGRLLRDGWRVRALSRRSDPALAETGVEIVHGSLEDRSSLDALVASAQAVIHCAGAITARNKADQLIHATRSSIKEHGGKLPAGQIGPIEAALADLETAMKGDDQAQIEARSAALEQVSQSLFAAAAAGQSGPDATAQGSTADARNDDVVDAEFTEVKGDKK